MVKRHTPNIELPTDDAEVELPPVTTEAPVPHAHANGKGKPRRKRKDLRRFASLRLPDRMAMREAIVSVHLADCIVTSDGHVNGRHAVSRLDVQLTPQCTITLTRMTQALDANGARTNDGKRITTTGMALRWLLEQIGEACREGVETSPLHFLDLREAWDQADNPERYSEYELTV